MATLSPQQADLLLQKLGSDEKFYALFNSDPAAALDQLGLPVEFAACCKKAKNIASQETIRQSRSRLLGDLTKSMDQSIITLDAR